MTNTKLVLIVEDEPDLASLLAQYVSNAGYTAHIISNGLEVEPWLEQNQAHLIVLDLMLPGKGGLDICKSIRKSKQTPIIMTTAKVEEIDRLLGLELGADDYICKPYSPREVVARIKTVLRRIEQTGDTVAQADTGVDIMIDQDRLRIIIRGVVLELTQIELNLFKLLYDEPGRIFSRQHILDNIYHDYRIVSDRTVDSHIKKLRKKLHDTHPSSDLIKSIYGVGYKFEPDFSEQ
ncbi:response regulator [Agarilytica rhodophyticola]|uniref:response regulator n=1 Tax=Agarilytica rhodophyticola TaxID=1737490 RepID=UPI000B345C5F|nr:response regulator [Agarilytica rhodophyticola]